MMEGNYAKVLTEKREAVFNMVFQKLQEAVVLRQQETRAEAASTANMAPASTSQLEVGPMAIISNMVGYAADLERIV